MKHLIWILVLGMVVALSGCGEKPNPSAPATTQTQSKSEGDPSPRVKVVGRAACQVGQCCLWVQRSCYAQSLSVPPCSPVASLFIRLRQTLR